jgi:heme oxygenase (biliverdin-IX-beta and delta-forming)
MPPPNHLRDRLRQSTREDHTQVDGLLSALNLGSPKDYVRFLGIHAAALSQLGSRTSLTDRADMAALMSCLASDLDFYGARQPRAATGVSGDSPARQLGISYVIRGSRLGAAVLARRVAADAPSAYLAYRSSTTWASFVLSLEAFARSHPPESEQEVIEGAKAAFGVFLQATQSAEPIQ